MIHTYLFQCVLAYVLLSTPCISSDAHKLNDSRRRHNGHDAIGPIVTKTKSGQHKLDVVQKRGKTGRRREVYVIIAISKQESEYIAHWLLYHHLIGIKREYLNAM